MEKQLAQQFEAVFGVSHEFEFFAPGRINLIGEHIDYSGGSVFPCAITYGTYALVRKRNDKQLNLYSTNFEHLGIITSEVDKLVYNENDDWANYPKGVIKMFELEGHVCDFGLDILYYGNIPNGAGLSSSASIEVLTAWIVNKLFHFNEDMITCVKLSQKAENEFIGVNCGIMDQFAVGMGQKDHAILLNTNSLAYEYVPVELGDASIVIANTNKRRGLADSAYNERRAQCEKALAILKEEYNIEHLCDLSLDQLIAKESLFDDKVVYRRAYHAVSENERTKRASEVLKSGDINAFGMLMNESHQSLRDDYEVTGIELDTLVESAWSQTGTIGARVTGAGFGGCAIAIVENQHVDAFIKNVGKRYADKIGYEATFYVASVGEGTHQIK
ncbi:galactokinase [Erysipelothrix rhusiopathiae]|uniref:galactokinase n=1 Tax=Erysipelothrix rhusiopathiae TaxID=1648 RepID=UPI000210B7D3|nr:galactokinase [Erysipelothrix rhusiopathiae]AMS10936.1 galactokinase [Erysipelothrix rhusiopathiae]AOO66792.1 galactokinase [Erysipelothrix rhusiopathiae]AWU41698.1 galactokinase [Erysipelothrix rhusiopathiae]MDE8283065.1 galactokinase [Erysipelothrix rhusiopathiae]MDV7677955.1 galactokinase [Erysipelothrix rhusiopathiae]